MVIGPRLASGRAASLACLAALALAALTVACPPSGGGIPDAGLPPCTPSAPNCTCDSKPWTSGQSFTFFAVDKTTRCSDPQHANASFQANSLADATACMNGTIANTNDVAVSSVTTFMFAVYIPDGAGTYICGLQPATSDSAVGAQTCVKSLDPCSGTGCVYQDVTAQVSAPGGGFDNNKVGLWCHDHPTPPP